MRDVVASYINTFTLSYHVDLMKNVGITIVIPLLMLRSLHPIEVMGITTKNKKKMKRHSFRTTVSTLTLT